MKKRLQRWLGIAALAAGNEALRKRMEELESRLNEIHPPLTLSKPHKKTAERLRPRNWSDAKKLLEEGESDARR